MTEHIKLGHLQCAFMKLTEASQIYILGLVEGLRHAQGTSNGKSPVKILNNSCDDSSVLFNCSVEKEIYP